MKTKTLIATCLSACVLTSMPLQAGLLDGLSGGSGDTAGSESRLQPGDPIAGRYIVTLSENLPDMIGVPGFRSAVTTLLQSVGGGDIIHLYQTAMTGAAVSLSKQQAELLSSLPGVLAIEADRVSGTSAQQANATWGLDRSDQAFLPLDSSYDYPNHAGAGVSVYIIDTGLRDSHEEFAGRVEPGQNFAGSSSGLLGGGLLGGLFGGGEDTSGDTNDCNGHGTHVASTAVGTTYGVAKSASVVPVRVLDCNGLGSNADVIAGVEWVAENHSKPAVANMSLGGGNSTALDDAVEGAIAEGVAFVVAAGNSDADACVGSPNRVPAAITVGSTTREDDRSSFSNYGECLDLFAPGSNITGAWIGGDADTNTISGTSMAAPHVAGAAALLLGADSSLTPAVVDSGLTELATQNVLSGIEAGSPNLLLRVPE